MSLNVIKQKKSTLFKHLILFDFFFFDSSVKHSLLHFGTFPVSGINKKIYVLNLVEQFKSFKQFFRLLQFLQKSKQKKSLNIVIPSEENAILLQQMLKLRFQTQIITSFAKQQKSNNPLKMLLLLDYPTLRPMHVLNNITRNKFNLVQTINSFFELNSSGYYKIHNNLSNLKRLIFIGVLLKQILK
jgi:hypothetical protein